MLVTDNGSVFTSSEFTDFIKRNGIHHITSSPYHPSSNGLAERAVQTMKDGLRKLAKGSVETKLSRFLFKHRLTPQTVTGVSPAEMMFGRPLHSQLDLLQPDIKVKVQGRQEQQKLHHDHHAKSQCGDLVHVRNFSQGPMWIPGVVIQVRGPVSYTVELANGEQKRRHVDHLCQEWKQLKRVCQIGQV
jgi:transposase InsO family protein